MNKANPDQKTSFFIILNPVSARGKAWKLLPLIETFFRSRSTNFQVKVTGQGGEATALARKAASAGYEVVIAVGGDGTVNEVANGLVGSSTSLGIIPCGVGNDFARTLSLPKNWKRACECLVAGKHKTIDVGIANGRYFVNAAGAGFDAAVAREVLSSKKLIGGIWPYLLAVFKTLFRFQRGEIELAFDGSRISTRAWLAAVTNGPTYGGGMKICPQAKLDDGLLDFCVVGDISLWRVIYYLPLIIAGKHPGLPGVYSGKAAELTLTTPGYPFHMEGEVLDCDKLEISLKPQALKVIVP